MTVTDRPDRRTGRPPLGAGFGWRVPLVAVLLGLGVLVGFARFGMRQGPAPAATPSAVAVVTSAASPTVAPTALGDSRSALYSPAAPFVRFIRGTPFSSAVSPWPGRFADGIPSVLDGDPVIRVNQALDVALALDNNTSTTMLIGGWYESSEFDGSGTLADSPMLTFGGGVSVEGNVGGPGPVVILGVADAKCAAPVAEGLVNFCHYAIRADRVLWQGDELTDTSPIRVLPLLEALSAKFASFAPEPYHDSPACTLPRPAQSFKSLSGEVQLVFVFESTAAREDGATSVLNGPPFGSQVTGCDQREPLDGLAGWISDQNVLVRVSGYNGPGGAAVRNILAGLTRK